MTASEPGVPSAAARAAAGSAGAADPCAPVGLSEVADLLILGAGPAGCAAALRALQLRPDARVVLMDAADFPRDKACGDGIAPHGLDVLRALGVSDAVAGYRSVDRMRLRTPGGAEVATPCRRANHVVPRTVFDARLVAAARARGAVLLRRRARSVVAGGSVDEPVVVVNGDLRARVVVGADGANSTTRRALGIGPNPPEALAIAVRGYADAPHTSGPPEQLIEMTDEGWPAYAWSFPIGDGRANIGYGMLRSKLAALHGDAAGRTVLHGTLARMLPDQPAHPGTLRAHHLPLSTWRPRQPDGPVLLAGDAASLINPLTGEGIYYALLSGSLAGAAAVTATPARAGAAYRKALDRELGRHLRHTALLAGLAGRRRTLMDSAVRAARHRTELYDNLVEIGLGRGTIPTASVARLALRKLALPG
ncbi:geranylgeranyl reductase family protein [Frankia sp. Cr2]|uniref:NAD(P)/FAD-dependent oxidoreductase n=1 Tax=Frankia sp. Cr2 TaxID=3073932 RepID=UPI002AD577A3|nr:geranylgeranyl reductase family protein [Frankia sp. Cr2]